MAQQWYYQIMGQDMGPIEAHDLREMVNSGDITRTTLVRKGEDGEWILAERIAGLFPDIRPVLPPRPEPPPPPPRPPEASAPPGPPEADIPLGPAAPTQPSPHLAEAREEKERAAAAPKTELQIPGANAGFLPLILNCFTTSFRQLFTPDLVRVLHAVNIVVFVLTCVFSVMGAVLAPSIAGIFGALLTCVIALAGLMAVRVALEIALVIFGIAHRLGAVTETKGAWRPASRDEPK